jgi:hypothetical protein
MRYDDIISILTRRHNRYSTHRKIWAALSRADKLSHNILKKEKLGVNRSLYVEITSNLKSTTTNVDTVRNISIVSPHI